MLPLSERPHHGESNSTVLHRGCVPMCPSVNRRARGLAPPNWRENGRPLGVMIPERPTLYRYTSARKLLAHQPVPRLV